MSGAGAVVGWGRVYEQNVQHVLKHYPSCLAAAWAGLGWAGLGWAGLEMAGFLSGVLPLRGPVGGHTDCVTTNTTSTLSVSAHTFVCLKIETLHLVHQVPRDEDYIFYQTRTT